MIISQYIFILLLSAVLLLFHHSKFEKTFSLELISYYFKTIESMSAFSSKYRQIGMRSYSSQMFLMVAKSQKNTGTDSPSVPLGISFQRKSSREGTVIVEREKRHGKRDKDSARSVLTWWWAEPVKMRKFYQWCLKSKIDPET